MGVPAVLSYGKIKKPRLFHILRDEVILRGSTLIETLSKKYLKTCHPLGTRNVCKTYPANNPYPDSRYTMFAGSTPGCTSQQFPLKLLSAGDSFSLTVSCAATLSVQCLSRIEYNIC